MLYKLFRATLRRQSITRFLQNQRLRNIILSGQGIDLSGYPDSQYHKLLRKEGDVKIVYANLHSPREDMLCIDLEKPFPVESDSQDFLLLMNVLEHLFGYRKCLSECFRVLKPGGRLIGVTPFLSPVHLVPDDIVRLTESSYHKIFNELSFSEINVEPIGFGSWHSASSSNSLKTRSPLCPIKEAMQL